VKGKAEVYAINDTTPPASLILALSGELNVNNHAAKQKCGRTNSAFSETKRAFTIKGSFGRLKKRRLRNPDPVASKFKKIDAHSISQNLSVSEFQRVNNGDNIRVFSKTLLLFLRHKTP
jgi:hypothetical protein